MNRSRLTLLLLGLGIVIILAGFVYDIIFAGIPYQDPTPVMLASYNMHAQIASTFRWSGALLLGVAILSLIQKRTIKNR